MIELKVYQKDKRWWKNISFPTYSLLIFIFIFSVLQIFKIDSQYLLIPIILYIIGLVIYHSYEFEPLSGKVIGKLYLKDKVISVLNREIHFSEIKYINIDASYYRGFNKDKASYDNTGRKYHSGNNNYYRIILKNNEEIRGEFIIERENQFLEVNEYYKNLKKIFTT
ncbi:MAG: hypothetical protein P0Y62_03625 [Candidatus Chryseobacterium colombiense]|nr:hypothetical protein [Chryseobacterium sp.]WEK70648.1 MAG: hypothetical protein P0Y62_03625 [Chryseobacterium sp.]